MVMVELLLFLLSFVVFGLWMVEAEARGTLQTHGWRWANDQS